MERIIKHIERLLLQHDCVIIPDFGGFVLQSIPAVYQDEEHAFTPARKEIVFNPTLMHNDGLLMESYMQAYQIDFARAQQFVRKDVAEMKELLDDYSELEMDAIGIILKEGERLVFMPGKYSDELFSVPSYGLPVFHYLPLSARLPQADMSVGGSQQVEITQPSETLEKTEKPRTHVIYSIPVTRTFLRVVGAAAAAILLFLFITTPIDDVNKASYSASFVPQEIMPKKTADEILAEAFSATNVSSSSQTDDAGYLPETGISSSVAEVKPESTKPSSPTPSTTISATTESSSATASEATATKATATKATASEATASEATAKAATSEATASEATTAKATASEATTTKATASEATTKAASTSTKTTSTKTTSTKTTATKATTANGGAKYYVIIGSFRTKAQAQQYIKELRGTKEAGMAQLLVRDGRVRVFVQTFMSEQSAQSYLNQLHQNPRHKQAWIYK